MTTQETGFSYFAQQESRVAREIQVTQTDYAGGSQSVSFSHGFHLLGLFGLIKVKQMLFETNTCVSVSSLCVLPLTGLRHKSKTPDRFFLFIGQAKR